MHAFTILVKREFRAAMRERTLVVYSFLFPLLMYPVMLWLVLMGLTFVEGQRERQPARVALVNSDGLELPSSLFDLDKIDHQPEIRDRDDQTAATIAVEQVRAGELDLAVELRAAESSIVGDLRVYLHHDSSRNRSRVALERFTEHLDGQREAALRERALAAGLPAPHWEWIEVERNNHAQEEEMGAFLLARVLPMTLLIMIAIGATYPAIDTIAGERERQTWETTVTLPVSRITILAAKFTYVVGMAAMAGALNAGGMIVSLRTMLTHAGIDSFELSLPWSSVPMIVLALMLTAGLVAALMFVAASFATTFKQGQSLTSPVMIVLMMAPIGLAQIPDDSLHLTMALIPVGGLGLVLRELLAGGTNWTFVALGLATNLAFVAGCVSLGLRMFRDESMWSESSRGPRTHWRTMFAKPSE